jgi:hypothetical protein
MRAATIRCHGGIVDRVLGVRGWGGESVQAGADSVGAHALLGPEVVDDVGAHGGE